MMKRMKRRKKRKKQRRKKRQGCQMLKRIAWCLEKECFHVHPKKTKVLTRIVPYFVKIALIII